MYKRSHGVVAAGVCVGLLLIAGPAFADPYKWCAAYRTGGQNCGFTSIEQCQATIAGAGGFCQQNPFYTGSDKKQSSSPATKVSRAKPPENKPPESKPPERTSQKRRTPDNRGDEDRFQ